MDNGVMVVPIYDLHRLIGLTDGIISENSGIIGQIAENIDRSENAPCHDPADALDRKSVV